MTYFQHFFRTIPGVLAVSDISLYLFDRYQKQIQRTTEWEASRLVYPFQRLWWSSNLTRYLSMYYYNILWSCTKVVPLQHTLKLYYRCGITTSSKVVVKIFQVPQIAFVKVQDFIHSRLPLYICGAVIGRKVAKSISEMALRLQHHHRRYLIESTCKRCVGVSEYFNEWYFHSRILCWQCIAFKWKKRHLPGDWASHIVK